MSCSSDDENENGGNTANSDFILNIDGTDYPMWVNGVELDEDYFVFLLYSNKTGIDPDIVLSYYGVISDYNVPTSVANESQLFFYDEFYEYYSGSASAKQDKSNRTVEIKYNGKWKQTNGDKIITINGTVPIKY
ncbi:MAG: hypothetical protein LUH15_17420 [Tannerellaceae bacterium]|nr:hypothetical protein [Tannerellaceae bacterium]